MADTGYNKGEKWENHYHIGTLKFIGENGGSLRGASSSGIRLPAAIGKPSGGFISIPTCGLMFHPAIVRYGASEQQSVPLVAYPQRPGPPDRDHISSFYVEKQVPISIDVVLDNVFKDSTNL